MSIPTATARRSVKAQILEALKILGLDDRRVVLEDLLEDVYAAATPAAPVIATSAVTLAGVTSNGSGTAGPPPLQSPGRSMLKLSETLRAMQRAQVEGAEATERATLAMTIKAWCLEHPTRDGSYSLSDVTRAVLPKDPKASSKVYSTILRASPQSDRPAPKHPKFIWLGEGKFKLFGGYPDSKENSREGGGGLVEP